MSLKDIDDEVKHVQSMNKEHEKAERGQALPNPFENIPKGKPRMRYTTTLSLTSAEYDIVRALKSQGVTLLGIFRRGLREYS